MNDLSRKAVGGAIREMAPADAPRVLDIYRQGLETGDATFQAEAPAWPDWEFAHLSPCRVVAVTNGEIAGWAALAPVSSRPVYRGVEELCLYIARISAALVLADGS